MPAGSAIVSAVRTSRYEGKPMRFETGNKLSGGRPRGSRNRLAGRVRPTNPLPPAADLSDGLPARAPAPIPPLTASQQSSSSKVQPHRVRTQLERPSERNPGGTIAEGWYRVSGGVAGQNDRTGAISRCGDEMMRVMLYEAAQSMLVRSTKWS